MLAEGGVADPRVSNKISDGMTYKNQIWYEDFSFLHADQVWLARKSILIVHATPPSFDTTPHSPTTTSPSPIIMTICPCFCLFVCVRVSFCPMSLSFYTLGGILSLSKIKVCKEYIKCIYSWSGRRAKRYSHVQRIYILDQGDRLSRYSHVR